MPGEGLTGNVGEGKQGNCPGYDETHQTDLFLKAVFDTGGLDELIRGLFLYRKLR